MAGRRSHRSGPDPVAVEVIEHGPAVLHADDGRVVPPDSARPASEGDVGVAPPADPVLTGAEVRGALDDTRYVFVHRPDQLVPVRLTPDEARTFLRRASGFPQPVIVTARVRGSDMVVHTLHYLSGSPLHLRRSEDASVASDASPVPPVDVLASDLLRGLGRPRRVARGRLTRKRPHHGLLVVPVSVGSPRMRASTPSKPDAGDGERLPPGVTAVDDRDSY